MSNSTMACQTISRQLKQVNIASALVSQLRALKATPWMLGGMVVRHCSALAERNGWDQRILGKGNNRNPGRIPYESRFHNMFSWISIDKLQLQHHKAKDLTTEQDQWLRVCKHLSYFQMPGVSKGCLLEVLKYLKASKKRSFEIPGFWMVLVFGSTPSHLCVCCLESVSSYAGPFHRVTPCAAAWWMHPHSSSGSSLRWEARLLEPCLCCPENKWKHRKDSPAQTCILYHLVSILALLLSSPIWIQRKKQ